MSASNGAVKMIGAIDIVCLIFIAMWFIVGAKKGFLHGILRVLVMLICLVIAYLLYPYIKEALSNFLTYGPRLDKAVFVGVFLLINVSVSGIAGRFLDTLGSSNALSMGNRVVGAFLGGIQGLLYTAAFLILLSVVLNPDAKLKKQIDSGSVTGNIQKTIVISYGSLDKIIRKTGMNPFLDEVEGLLKP